MKRMNDYYQHGDVIVVKIDELPDGMTKRNDLVLEEGEVTGHRHQIMTLERATLFEKAFEGTKLKFLEVKQPVDLVHEEHGTINLMPGLYSVERINMKDPYSKMVSKVMD
jgi:hypothetical protein